jgi:hypothetical protein
LTGRKKDFLTGKKKCQPQSINVPLGDKLPLQGMLSHGFRIVAAKKCTTVKEMGGED